MGNVDTIFPSSNETPYVADLNNDGYLDIITGVWRDYDFSNLLACSWVYWGSNEGWSDSNRVCLIGTDFWMFSSAIYTTYSIQRFLMQYFSSIAPLIP
jgi:hypothetical protein